MAYEDSYEISLQVAEGFACEINDCLLASVKTYNIILLII